MSFYTCKLEYFTLTYGEEEGYKKYVSNKFNFSGYSKISNIFFEQLDLKLFMNFKTYFQTKNKEWFIYTNNKKHYFVDYFIKDLNLVIEFHGDYFHANPLIYDKKSWNFFDSEAKITKEMIYNRDEIREDNILKEGYKLICLWEAYYNKYDLNIIIKEIEDFIYSDNSYLELNIWN